ncbi:MAG TPA: hypothetical protein VGE12_00525 [Noviherbaspirillum sp.]
MSTATRFEADLTVQSFAYVAKQLAPTAQYEQILSEAERHRSALRLMQRDAFALAELELRKQTLTRAEFQQLRETAAQKIAQAEQAINRIAAQYAPHKIAA